jgi:Fe-S-cluster-containing dehydrogenase component
MPRLGLVIDLKRCIGCNACVLACKQEQGTPPGIHFARVITREVGTYPQAKRTFLPVLCNHCADPACEKACPTGATYTRPDGIVMVDNDRCIGCRACAVACPYLHRHFVEPGSLGVGYGGNGLNPYESFKYADFQEGTVIKCTLCAHRVDRGLEPACVITCPTEARIFGDLEEEDGRLQKLIKERKGWTLLPQCETKPSVYYLDS